MKSIIFEKQITTKQITMNTKVIKSKSKNEKVIINRRKDPNNGYDYYFTFLYSPAHNPTMEFIKEIKHPEKSSLNDAISYANQLLNN